MIVCKSGRIRTPSRVAPQVMILSQQIAVTGFLSPAEYEPAESEQAGKENTNMTDIPYKIYLEETEMPEAWYNLRADMKNKPAPLLNPGTGKPMTAEELSGVFCADLVAQELDDTTPFIAIPEEIRNFYKMHRPSPLVRAY